MGRGLQIDFHLTTQCHDTMLQGCMCSSIVIFVKWYSIRGLKLFYSVSVCFMELQVLTYCIPVTLYCYWSVYVCIIRMQPFQRYTYFAISFVLEYNCLLYNWYNSITYKNTTCVVKCYNNWCILHYKKNFSVVNSIHRVVLLLYCCECNIVPV